MTLAKAFGGVSTEFNHDMMHRAIFQSRSDDTMIIANPFMTLFATLKNYPQ